MKPRYTTIGLDAYRAAVPLPIPLPPGDPAGWTCLYTLIGGRLAFLEQGYLEIAPDSLLRSLLELAGRPCSRDESRVLLLVTPIPGEVDLVALLQRAMRGNNGEEAARMLGYLDDPDAAGVLLDRLADPDISLRTEAITALGRLGAGRDLLGQWDGDTDADRLLALARQGVVPDELPTGELEPLAAWIPGLESGAGRTLIEAIDELTETLQLAVAHVLASHPAAAAELAEALAQNLGRVCDHPAWAGAIAAAGEEVVDLVLEGLTGEDWRARMGAAIVLGQLPEAGERGIASLRRALTDDDSDVRREAGLALSRRGGSLQVEAWSQSYGFLDRAGDHPWGAALNGGPVPIDLFALLARRDGGEVISRACFALAFGHPELAAPALEALARDYGYDVPLDARQAAAAALLSTGVAPSGVAGLHRILLRGISTNGTTGPIEGVAVADLVVLASRDGDWQVRHSALGFLEKTGEAARYDGLLAMLSAVDSDSDVRERAASMRSRGFNEQSVEAVLAKLVTSSRVDDEQRARALADLSLLDAALADSLATSMLDHTDRSVAVLAGRIAGGSAPAEQVEARVMRALGQLRSFDWIRREAAAALLGSVDPRGLEGSLFEELVETLEAASTGDDDNDVQRMASWAAAELKRRRV